MKNEPGVIDELRSMNSILAELPRTMPFDTLADYFDRVPSNVIDLVKESSEFSNIPATGRSVPYTVPFGYFDQLTGTIMEAAGTEQLEAQVSRTMPHNVPAGYFEDLAEKVLVAAKNADTEKHRPRIIPLRQLTARYIRWAVAAVLVLSIGLGAYLSFSDNKPASTDRILASVPRDVIHDYLQHTYRVDVDRIVGNSDVNNLQLEDKDIIQYLNDTGWDVAD